MSSLSEVDHLNPNDPKYYAPRWLRERPEATLSPSHHRVAEPREAHAAPPVPLDTQLENAVSNALWHPLDPEIMQEPPELAHELDQRAALMSVAGRFAAAVGVSAAVALFFVIMVPASRLPDSSNTTSAGILKSLKTALLPNGGAHDDGAKPALAEFQPILTSASASVQTNQPASREQSTQLLQQFLQWQQKPQTGASQ